MTNGIRSKNGIAIVVVLLVSVVALTAVVAAASVAALGSRQVTAIERRATVALFAAESGLNSILARSRTPEYAFDEAVHDSIQEWLVAVGLDSYELPGGATVELDAVAEVDGVVTIRAVGIAPDGTQRTVLQDFVREEALVSLDLFADAALITKPALRTNSKNSQLIGLGLSEDEWRFEGISLTSARVGDYAEYGGALYRVAAIDAGAVTLEGVDVAVGSEVLDETETVTLLPFALTAANPGPFFSGTVLSVTTTVPYSVGGTIEVGDGRAVITNVGATELTVDWIVIPTSLAEGEPLRKIVPSAIAEGGCPTGAKIDEKLPQGCIEQALGDLFANTFDGWSKSDLWEYAQAEGTCCDWPANGTVLSGLTWIDGASTGDANSARLCGEGIIVLNTGATPLENPGKININTDGCEFRGVLYVIGQLSLAGNLDTFSGAVIVEGPNDTSVQGTGDKALFDPIAIRDALEALPPASTEAGLLGALPLTWRYGE